MRIVSYNVNGLRPRLISPPRTLAAFLDSLDADIICLQETKIARHDLTADIAVAEGYESFFSCNRTFRKGRIGYSGVATFCRVEQGKSSTNPILPLAADEGFTGLLHRLETGETEGGKGRVGYYEDIAKTELSTQDLLQLDSEGRCLVTDHGTFVLFNLYFPRVESGDTDRMQFKLNFCHTLQRRWETLLKQNRRIIAVGDFNIAPHAVDSCHAGPQFGRNLCRIWLRSLLRNEGGPFWDVFRYFHEDRKDAYTCWSQVTGAEEFNFGSRIDLAIAAGFCNHGMVSESSGHGFVECEVQDCDILTQFRRVKPDSLPKWQGGRSVKLEGSDHAPIVVHLKEQVPIESHEVPPLAARFMPEIRGRQQNLVTLLKRHSPNDGMDSQTDVRISKLSKAGESPTLRTTATSRKRGLQSAVKSPYMQRDLRAFFGSSSSQDKHNLAGEETSVTQNSNFIQDSNNDETESQQGWNDFIRLSEESLQTHLDPGSEGLQPGVGTVTCIQDMGPSPSSNPSQINLSSEMLDIDAEFFTPGMKHIRDAPGTNNLDASSAWAKIKKKMARAIPLCKGHREPCVSRVVKKAGPNIGRGFYSCARAEGPSSNPETRCNHFEWVSNFKQAGKVAGQNRL